MFFKDGLANSTATHMSTLDVLLVCNTVKPLRFLHAIQLETKLF